MFKTDDIFFLYNENNYLKYIKFLDVNIQYVHFPMPLLHFKRDIGLISRVFANGTGNHGTTSGRVIRKTRKMVLDAALLHTQHYKIRIKVKVEQSRERSNALPYPTG